METSEILQRLYGVQARRRGPTKMAKRWLRRGVRWVQDHNWSLILIALGLLTGIRDEPIFDPICDDPRFQDLLRRMHYPGTA